MSASFADLGYTVKGFNYDTLAATGISTENALESIKNAPSPERDASIDAYNAKWDRRANYARAIGWTMVAIGTGGVAACEVGGAILVSQGMLAEASFLGGSVVTAATAGGGAVAVGSTVQVEEELDEITQIDAALAGESGTPQAPPPRGPTFTSEYGGTYSSKTNAAGGEVWTSVGRVNQYDVRDVVNETYRGGNINILTGVHGSATGATAVEDGFLSADELEFYNGTPGIRIYNMPSMLDSDITRLLRGPDTTIGAFCNSEACLARFR
jgi:hypothetical protein